VLVGGKVGDTGDKGRKDGKEHGAKRHKVSDLLLLLVGYNDGAFLVVHAFKSSRNSGRVTGSDVT